MTEAVAVQPNPLLSEIQKQIAAEIDAAEVTKEQKFMLEQKYGVFAPQLTPSENYLIQKEERKRAGNPKRN